MGLVHVFNYEVEPKSRYSVGYGRESTVFEWFRGERGVSGASSELCVEWRAERCAGNNEDAFGVVLPTTHGCETVRGRRVHLGGSDKGEVAL